MPKRIKGLTWEPVFLAWKYRKETTGFCPECGAAMPVPKAKAYVFKERICCEKCAGK